MAKYNYTCAKRPIKRPVYTFVYEKRPVQETYVICVVTSTDTNGNDTYGKRDLYICKETYKETFIHICMGKESCERDLLKRPIYT